MQVIIIIIIIIIIDMFRERCLFHQYRFIFCATVISIEYPCEGLPCTYRHVTYIFSYVVTLSFH